MLVNLINEKKNKKITSKQIANLLNTREATISDKLNGKSRFSFDEAIIIQKVFFPEYKLEYLFKHDE